MAARPEQEYNLIRGVLERFERHPVVEIGATPEISPDLRSYVQKVETGSEVKPPGMPLGKPSAKPLPPGQKSILLPLTPTQYVQGTKASVSDSLRWLAVWCLRILKIYGPNALFRPEPNL
jgi:hypothetical protein